MERKRAERFWVRHVMLLSLLAAMPVIMGPGRCVTSAGGFFSGEPAPDMRGEWAVTYDNQIAVEIDLGGGAGLHTGTVPEEGGVVSFVVDNEPVDLDLDCTLPWIVCPSEVWPATVEFEQRNFENRPHQVWMEFTDVRCLDPRMPVEAEGECSSDPADNMPCDQEICDPENVQETLVQKIASISNPVPAHPEVGSHPDYTIGIALSGGYIVPAANCLLVGASYADADLIYTGSYDPEANSMFGTELREGVVTVEFWGACFWGGYIGTNLAGALLGARVKFTTGFTAVKL